MERAVLKDLNASTRKEALAFLKKLWDREGAPCPVCGQALEPLHRKAKRSDCDWQCRACGRAYRTISLLDELNRQMPDGQEGR